MRYLSSAFRTIQRYPVLLWLPVGLAVLSASLFGGVFVARRSGHLGWLPLVVFAFFPFVASGVNVLIREAVYRRRVNLQVFMDNLGAYALPIAGGFLTILAVQALCSLGFMARSSLPGAATHLLLSLGHVWLAVTVVSGIPFPDSLLLTVKRIQQRFGDLAPLLLLALLWAAFGSVAGRHTTMLLTRVVPVAAPWRTLLGAAVVTAGTIFLRTAVFCAYTGETDY